MPDDAEIVIVVLEITMTEVTAETEELDEDNDEVLNVDELNEVDDRDELELELPSVGAIEAELLLDVEDEGDDLDADEDCLKVLVVKLLTNTELLVKSPVLKLMEELVLLGRQEDGIVLVQHGRANVAVVEGEKTPV